jgi:hypothetical protein
MLGSSVIVTLTLLFSGISSALPNNDVLPPGIDGTGGPRDLYAAAGRVNALDDIAEERGELVDMKKLPEENLEFEGMSLVSYSSRMVYSSLHRNGGQSPTL